MSFKTPKQLIAEFALANDNFDQALAAHGPHRDRLDQATTKADQRRAMLALAGSWAHVGDAALQIGKTLEACVEDQLLSDAEEAA